MSQFSTILRRRVAQAAVWAQVEHPVGTGKIIRKVTAAGSSKKKAQASKVSGRQHGMAAAESVAGIPPTTERVDGIIAANIAARVPGHH
ncbi:MAG: hypothetical protein Q3976_09490 [Corynebacterium sp.]|nr:hypothetical protein [Corynebacterium sp.]